MAQKRRNEESGLAFFMAAPWWVSAVAAVGWFIAFQWIIPAVTVSSPILKVVGQALKPLGYVLSAVLGLIALVNYFRQRSRPIVSPPLSWKDPPRPTPTINAHTDAVTKTWEDMMAKPPRPEPKPDEWSLDLLRRIEWKRFEELSAAFYREIGLRSETIRCGADGGIDAKLFCWGSPEPAAIVQCKAWNSRPVGVKPVRELLGVMAHQGAPKGIFIATGEFTKEAVEFAKANPIDLISGAAFMEMIRKLSDDAQQRLLAVATEGEFTTPTCPSCGIKMVWRNSDRGNFWGCSNYPQCKQTFFTKPLVA